ncbi:serine protease [Alkalilacustris brevis]|uniref:serine protease n=1 Tax=Alkalilacustris brevis TaxID=2026338 RepID=UPI000E0CE0B5|nr:serine protease [Alkalilacustris brevis]
MKRQIDRTVAAIALFTLFIAGFAASAQQNERIYLQVEAHPTLSRGLEFAERYADWFDNVHGYRLVQSGWYAIALGPFPDRDAADAERRALQATQMIPADAYVQPSTRYGERFWPAEGARADAPAPQPEAPALSAPQPEPAPETAPQETLAQARASEAQLGRDQRVEIQTALQWKGFYDLAIDASFGPGTRAAMTAWQEDRGYQPTGVLTTAQRAELLATYAAEQGAFGFETQRDEAAGIEITLPMGLVEFDRHEAPFAHYTARDGSGVQVLLISQEGSLATLFGLYEIMQTLEIVPPEGYRERRSNSFVLTGQSGSLRSHSYAEYRNGQVKGYSLIWSPEQDRRAERILAEMEASFAPFGGTLPDGLGQPLSEVQRSELLAGLEVRRPLRSRTGFYVGPTGVVVTSASLADGCRRLTIDDRHEASIVLHDADLGLLVLEPAEELAPLAFASFPARPPELHDEVILAGFPFDDLLSRPTLTFGSLTGLEGLKGEAMLRRLSIDAMEGDIGGPVFDRTGAVLGMLLPPDVFEGRQLPPDVRFALAGQAIHAALPGNGIRPASLERAEALQPEEISLLAADMTVRASCWE